MSGENTPQPTPGTPAPTGDQTPNTSGSTLLGVTESPQSTPPKPADALDWRTYISEDLRDNPSLRDIKDIGSLAKSYIHAQQLVGSEKVVIPKEDSPKEVVDQFYNKLGRPESPDGYELKKPEGFPEGELLFQEEGIKEFKQKFHELRLSKKQAEELFNYYNSYVVNKSQQYVQEIKEARESQINALKEEWGSGFSKNLSLAKRAVEEFGGPELKAYLNESGLGDDPRLIKAMAKAGQLLKEDSSIGGNSGGGFNTSPEWARSEIAKLNTDKSFLEVYLNANATGHTQAVERMQALFRTAYPEDIS